MLQINFLNNHALSETDLVISVIQFTKIIRDFQYSYTTCGSYILHAAFRI